MKNEKIATGGRNDKSRLLIEPTVLTDITYSSRIMQEEIFGPILPILTYTDINDVISHLKTREKPLALYIFSTNKYVQKKITESLSYGGGCINDTIVHLATSKMDLAVSVIVVWVLIMVNSVLIHSLIIKAF